MKGIEQIMFALVALVLALMIFGTGGLIKKSIFDDCSFIESAGAKATYAKTVQANMGNYGGGELPGSVYGFALLVSNIPSYATVQSATATRTYLGPDSYGVGKTAVNNIPYGGDLPGGRCNDKIIFSYPRQGLQGSFRLAPDTGQYVGGWDGTYNLKYDIVFIETVPTATPAPTPIATPAPTPIIAVQPPPYQVPRPTPFVAQPQFAGQRIPIISDLADLLRQLLAPLLSLLGIRV